MVYMQKAVTLCLLLLTGSLGFNTADATTNTTVRLDSLAGYPTTQGDTMIFSGRFVKGATDTGIQNSTINILHQISYSNSKIIATGLTDANGYYSIPWIVDVVKIAPEIGGSSGSTSKQGEVQRIQVKVIAQFDGDEEFIRSTSNAQSFEVRLNRLKIFVERKPVYLAFESFTLRLRIVDDGENLIDPDSLIVRFDNRVIELVYESIGIYSFRISSLNPGPHSLAAVAEKAGHVTDDQLVTIEGIKRNTELSITTDKPTYKRGENVIITTDLIDTSANVFVFEKEISASLTSPTLRGSTLAVVDGRATYKVSDFGPIGSWSIRASFAGDIAYSKSSNTFSFMVEEGTGIAFDDKDLVGEKVSLGRIGLVDQTGSELSNVSTGQQVMIQTKMTSNIASSEEVAYISQVKDADGITVSISWITGTISPGQSLELAISWLPDEPGRYNAEVFVWSDIISPEPLSNEVKRATILVK